MNNPAFQDVKWKPYPNTGAGDNLAQGAQKINENFSRFDDSLEGLNHQINQVAGAQFSGFIGRTTLIELQAVTQKPNGEPLDDGTPAMVTGDVDGDGNPTSNNGTYTWDAASSTWVKAPDRLAFFKRNLVSLFVDEGAAADGTTDAAAAIAATDVAHQVIGAYSGAFRVASDITLSASDGLFMAQGAHFIIDAGATLTIDVPLFASPNSTLFKGDGSVKLTARATSTVYAAWGGLYGDGVNDDTHALQRMLDSMQGPGTFIFPAGSFLHKGLVYTSGIRYFGAGAMATSMGQGQTRLQLADVTSPAPAGCLMAREWVDNVTSGGAGGTYFDHLQIDGNRSGNPATVDGIIAFGWNCTFGRHLYFTHTSGYAIRGPIHTKDGTPATANFVNPVLEAFRITDCTRGIIFGEHSGSAWTDGICRGAMFTVDGALGPDLELYSPGGWRIDRCVFNSPCNCAIAAHGNTNLSITNNRIDRLGRVGGVDSPQAIRVSQLGNQSGKWATLIQGNSITIHSNATGTPFGINLHAGGTSNNGYIQVTGNDYYTGVDSAVFCSMTSPQRIYGAICNNLVKGAGRVFDIEHDSMHKGLRLYENGGFNEASGADTDGITYKSTDQVRNAYSFSVNDAADATPSEVCRLDIAAFSASLALRIFAMARESYGKRVSIMAAWDVGIGKPISSNIPAVSITNIRNEIGYATSASKYSYNGLELTATKELNGDQTGTVKLSLKATSSGSESPFDSDLFLSIDVIGVGLQQITSSI